MDRDEFINLISFCVLMENGEGILGKAPSYVLEKYQTANPALLDGFNEHKLLEYIERWGFHFPTKV